MLERRGRRRAPSARSGTGADPVDSLVGVAVWAIPSTAALGTLVAGIPLEPDATYYTSGIALFPSPLGTVIGTLGGYAGLAAVNAAAVFAIVLLVGLIGRELGHSPLVAQAVALLVAPAMWFGSWGMDAPAVAMLLAAVLLNLRAERLWAASAVILACGIHLAALPLALAVVVLLSRRWRSLALGAALVALGVAVALATSYRAAYRLIDEPGALLEGASTLLAVCWPLLLLMLVLPVHRTMRVYVLGAALGAIVAAAIPAAVGHDGLTRYVVPVVFVAAAGMGFRRPTRFPAALARHGLPRFLVKVDLPSADRT